MDEPTEVIGLDKTLVAVFALILVAGLAGGFILNYVIYQPQIQALKENIDKLNDALADNITSYQASLNNLTAQISNLEARLPQNVTEQPANESASNNLTALVERLDFLSISAANNSGNFDISFSLKNTGTAGVAIDILYVNLTMQADVAELSSIVINDVSIPKTQILAIILRPGDSATGVITLTGGGKFASGDLVNLAFHSVTNVFYDRSVTLPS